MAKKLTPDQLNAQISALNTQLQNVKNTRDVLVNPTAATYFQQTQEQKLDDVTMSTYSSVYNAEFDKVRDIKLTVGADAKDKNNQAFFLFNPANEAKDITEARIASEKQQKDAYDAQQTRIKNWIKEKQGSQDMKIFDMYMQDMLDRDYSGLTDGFITSDSPMFSESKFRSTPSKDKSTSLVPSTDARGKTTMRTVKMYKDPQAAQTMRASLQEMYMKTFNEDAKLKDKWTNRYTQELQRQQQALKQQLNKLNKKK